MTTATEKFHADLAEVMAEVGYVQKDGKNDFHKYRYASAEAVLKKVNAALSERKIAVGSQAELLHYETAPDDKGKPTTKAAVRLTLTLMRGSDFVQVQGIGEGSDRGDKATLKANTSALKYVLANTFMISWGDDPEADSSTDSADDSKPRVKKFRGHSAYKKAAPEKGYDLSKEQAELERLIEAAEGVGKMEKDIKPRIVTLKEHDESVYKALVKTYKAKQKSLKEVA